MAKLHEECGVFGIFEHADAAKACAFALYALQHRGQEGCGIATQANGKLYLHKGLGQVKDVLTPEQLRLLPGSTAIAHARYSTTGGNEQRNTQPMLASTGHGSLALVHNGNLSNAAILRDSLEKQGMILQTNSDTEVIAYLLSNALLTTKEPVKAIQSLMGVLEGSYSLVILLGGAMYAVRDPWGMRPLCFGTVEGSVAVASESCALTSMGGRVDGDVQPGEIVKISEKGVEHIPQPKPKCGALCIFEHIYFARPDSEIDGQSVYQARIKAGEILAQTHPVQADLVIGVPDSGLIAALGYAQQSGIPYGEGLIKNRYIGRTFIEPTQEMRSAKVRLKLNPMRSVVAGKRIVVVDDSIVRGTTTGQIVSLLKSAGATQVHVRISAPPFLYPCFFGTDVATRDQLASVRWTHEELTKRIGADSLGFLPLERVREIAPKSSLGFCDGCFSGKYPYPIYESLE